MITINFSLKDMNGLPLSLGDRVKVYNDDFLDEDGEMITPKAGTSYHEGRIHWHNGSGGMHANGVVVKRDDGNFEYICTMNPDSESKGSCDENADTCWYIEKIDFENPVLRIGKNHLK